MAQSDNIINRWAFTEFRNMFGKVKRPRYTDSKGVEFSKLAMQREDKSYCFVGWSSQLGGELTNEELKAEQDNLMVVQLKVDEEELARRREAGYQLETYKVCRKGDYEHDDWEDIDI